jgi:hypothetical protein
MGSMAGQPLNQAMVGITGVPNGGGYWLVASDGGVFAFGNAPWYGSFSGTPLPSPVVGLYSVEVSVGSNVFGYCMVDANGAGPGCF